MQLRPYQRESVDATWAYLRAKPGNPCIVLPTGAGKTIVLAEIIREALTSWPGTRIAVVAHVRELVQQNHDKLRAYWPAGPAGIYAAGLGRRDRFNPVIFASIQSVAKRAMSLGRFDLVLVDEAHRIPLRSEGQYREFIAGCREANPALRIAGLTATPYRLGGGPVCGPGYILNEVAYEARVKDLIRDGYLSRLVSKAGAARADLSAVHVRNGEYVGGELERAVNVHSVVEAACDEIVAYCGQRRAWIVFCAGVAHAQAVTEALARRGVPCAQVDGATPSAVRAERIAAFQRGELRALVNVNVLSEGFDATHVDAVVMMRPTKSAALYYQQAGRGMRLHPGKADCLVLDFAGNIVEHGPVDAIRPPRAPGEKATSETPMRECPKCGELVMVQVRQCPACGHAWQFQQHPRHDATASDAPILSDEVAPPTELAVTSVRYASHVGRSGKPTLQVTYQCGLQAIREWVCLEHGGPVRARAVAWWMRRSTAPCPRTVDAALPLADALRSPAALSVRLGGKYPEILGHLFDDAVRDAA
jgi:DNA repair protein RadD